MSITDRLVRLTGATRRELPALAVAFALFFALLSGYYVLRSVREALIAADGQRLIPTVFTSVFVAMLLLTPVYGFVVSRFPRRRFLPIVFGTVVVALVGFAVAFRVERPADVVTTGFAIFLSVMNLFTVSVFWSFMADVFQREQAQRLFAAIAAGGTLGAIAGPSISRALAGEIGVSNLLLVSALFYAVCTALLLALLPWARRQTAVEGRYEDPEQAIGGSVIAGAKLVFARPLLLALVLHMFLGVSTGTLLYNQQAAVVGAMGLDAAARLEYFSTIDLATNLVALALQLGVTRWVLPRTGPGAVLLIPALLNIAAVALLAWSHAALGDRPDVRVAALVVSQAAVVVSAVQILTRGAAFGLVQPARESVYTHVDREARYKAKNFIDTVVYRGGDMVTTWVYAGFGALGLSLATIASAWLPVTFAWLAVVLWIRRELRRAGPPEASSLPQGAAP